MKYYLYVSGKKLDMLLPQLPLARKKKLDAELAVNIGVLKAGLKTQWASSEELTARLAAVSGHVQEYEDVGTIDKPKTWLWDTQYVTIASIKPSRELVFFAGRTKTTEFLLGGSAGHLVSDSAPTELSFGWSFLPRLLRGLEYVLNGSAELTLPEDKLHLELAKGVGSDDSTHEWHDLVGAVANRISGPNVRIEFLAKRLLSRRNKTPAEPSSVLATPLYVAMAD